MRRAAIAFVVSLILGALASIRSCGEPSDSLVQRVGMEGEYGPVQCAADAARLERVGNPLQARVLAEPDPTAREAARELALAHPGARVYFSQNTGQPLWVHGDGEPLVSGPHDPADPSEAFATLRAFLAEWPDLFGLVDPGAELVILDELPDPTDPTPTLTGRPRYRVDPQTGSPTLHVAQVHRGIPIDGHHLVAFFDDQGDLLSVVGRLLPTAEVAQTWQPIPEDFSRSKPWTSGLELRWDRVDGEPVLVDRSRRAVEGGPVVHRVAVRDPSTGDLVDVVERVEIRSFLPIESELLAALGDGGQGEPSVDDLLNWTLTGEVVQRSAPDSWSRKVPVLSTVEEEGLYLGWHSAVYLAPGQVASVADAKGRLIAFAGLVYWPGPPLLTEAESWAEDPTYATSYPGATDLARSLQEVSEWYLDHHGHRSWDGRGSRLRGAVNANPWMLPDGFYNAYAGDGYLMVGDGRNPESGRTLAAARDVMAHEYTHLLLNGTARFRYAGESGAIAEGLADILGNSVEGRLDRGFEVAEDSGTPVRDLARPDRFEMPASYDQLQFTNADHGAVHINSGILGRTAVSIWEDHERDPMPLASLLVDALRYTPWDEAPRMEAFGAQLNAFCYQRQVAEPDPEREALCTSVKRGLCTTKLLAERPLIGDAP